MRKFFLLLVILPALLIGTAGRAAAQAPEVRNLATDTLQPANAKYHFPVSRLGAVGGKQLYVFVTSISERGNGIEFTWRNPLALPHPKPVFITSEQLQWALLGGQYYEPVRLADKKAFDLALRLSKGPRVEVFDVATLKKGVPIPLPGPGMVLVVWSGTYRNKFNHAWYLRRPGERTMVAVPEGKKFAPFMADYLADAPELVAAIRARATGSRYDDVPALLEAYNKLAAGH